MNPLDQSVSSLVSTIIPTYNRSAMVCEAIRSALAQVDVAQELIVVDDGSTDDTRAVLQREFGERIRYVHQTNAGVSSARNRGLSESRGELIAFLDSDDAWHPDKLKLQVEFLRAHHEYGLVLTDIEWVEPDGQTTRVQRRRGDIPEGGDILQAALREPTIVPSTALLRRSVYERVGGFDTTLKTAEDIDLYLRIAKSTKVGLLDEPLTRYRSGHESLSKPREAFTDYAFVLERFIRNHADELGRAAAQDGLFTTYERCSRGLLWMGEYRRSLHFFMRALPTARSAAHLQELLRLAARITYHRLKSAGSALRRRA